MWAAKPMVPRDPQFQYRSAMRSARYSRFSQLPLLAVVALTLAACGAPAASNASVDLGGSTQVNVVALFDRSGSTSENGSRVGIERAIWPAVFFPNLGRTYSLKVLPMGFSSVVTNWCDRWPEGSTDIEQSMSQSVACQAQLKGALSAGVGGRTYFDTALASAADKLSTVSGKNVVLLVSDGEFNKGNGNINCEEEDSSSCQELGAALDTLNQQRATVCPIFVRTNSSVEKESNTMDWLRARQQANDAQSESWDASACPASTTINLTSSPWQLAEDILVWYADLVHLQLRSTSTDNSGVTKEPIEVPNGAAQIALIGLKATPRSSVDFSPSDDCTQGEGRVFDSFEYAPISAPLEGGERCPRARISGSGLAPGQNGLYALFVPENQELAACTPNPGGGGTMTLRPGFAELLAYKPRVLWVSPKGESYDPQLRPEQLLGDGIALDEGQAEEFAARGGDWRIAFDFSASVNQPGKGEVYSLLYDSVVFRDEGAGQYAARRPISATIDSIPCAPQFGRSPFQKFWLPMLLAVTAAVAFVLWRMLRPVSIDGEIRVLDSTASRSIANVDLRGSSPAWFNVGPQSALEPGKSDGQGENWRLRWKKGTTAFWLEPEGGEKEVKDWSIGTPVRVRGVNAVEFRRVPLSGGANYTVQYLPQEGGKAEAALEKLLSEEGEG